MGQPIRSAAATYADPPFQEGDDLPSYLDLIAFCQLRWNFVRQRPHHLMSRWAKTRRVFFIEEPIFGGEETSADVSLHNGVYIVVPRLKDGVSDYKNQMTKVINELLQNYKIKDYICWYSTPMALAYSRQLTPQITVYDCMDDPSAFVNEQSAVRRYEKELIARSELVFTGGQSLYEARRYQHPNIHPLPSSIEAEHFNQARFINVDPGDQAEISHPRLGFFGVIDERIDINLLKGIAEARPDWHFIMIGAVAKIDSNFLPGFSNVHYLEPKGYVELPAYLAGWDVALLPFAQNEATRYISSTKTAEYLAAGRPVVSTPIRDVVCPYGEMKLVHIADSIESFLTAAQVAMQEGKEKRWLNRVDAFLERTSWDHTWSRMNRLIYQTLKSKSLLHNYGSSTIFIPAAIEKFVSFEADADGRAD